MVKDIIFKGWKINTTEGYALVTGFNGSAVYLDMYVADDNGYCHFEEERVLTLHEVGLLMKEVDGKNHKVSWQVEEDED